MKNCRIKEAKEVVILQSSNKFKVLASRVMNIGERSRREVKKDRKIVLREKRVRRRKKD